ncbi:MAG: hypothetical protein HY658_09695 [Actinobacteria bacterium]|nr:hypothetical protein [Actinomycetota bacterium]
MKRLVAASALGVALLSSCHTADRPEGVVDRWLTSLNQGSAGEPDLYADEEVTVWILGPWRECDPGALDVIEVGGGTESAASARVPFRVGLARTVESLCGPSGLLPGAEIEGVAILERRDGEWRIVDLGPPDPALRVPSEGGERIGKASAAAWAGGVGVAVALSLLTVALMRLFGRHPTAAERVGADAPAP